MNGHFGLGCFICCVSLLLWEFWLELVLASLPHKGKDNQQPAGASRESGLV
jgi:hypothetical protein